MIMAQHPQAPPKSQHNHDHHQPPPPAQHPTTIDIRQSQQQQQHLETKISNSQSQQEQDGKRTLIKNQLYLIEQLQLENANLRNERDQLQLENEELKFQLQMISSSNILNQPNSTFNNNQQLDRIVENGNENEINGINIAIKSNGDGNFNNNNHLSSTNNNLRTNTTTNFNEKSTNNNNDGCNSELNDISNFNIVTSSVPNKHCNQNQSQIQSQKQIKLLATPLRQPILTSRSTLANIPNLNCKSNDYQQQQIILTNNSRANIATDNNNTTGQQTVRLTSAASLTDCRSSNFISNKVELVTTGTTTSGSKLLAGKSTTLVPFNVKTISSCNPSSIYNNHQHQQPQSRNLPQDDDEQAAIELVEQNYGGDSELIQASAIIIQRAFRKYQICKRFRTITEQLRQTTTTSSSSSWSSKPTSTLSANSNKQSSSLDNKKRDNTNDSLSTTFTTDQIPYASGTTRAAAWESLSQAANRLAAAAAAAKQQQQQQQQTIKNSLTVNSNNNIRKFANQQQQQQQELNSITTSSIVSNQTACINKKQQQDPVVAAAINFQQLESIRKRQYRVGLNVFNKNPEKGVSFLIAHSFIDSTPPYTKTSTSYYHSNQLHFIDNKQHHNLVQQLALPTSNSKDLINDLQQFKCQICIDEENLKRNVAHFLLHRKGLAKEKIGQYLGNLQSQFNQDVLKYYLQELDFNGLQIDLALRKFLSTFRLPGEAQKIEKIVDNFAQRYVQCQQQQQILSTLTSNLSNGNIAQNQEQIQNQKNQPTNVIVNSQQQQQQNVNNNNYKNNLILLTKDEIFILTFAIIMLNTDLHSPSLKPTSRMSAGQFVNNLRGVFKSQMINECDLIEIYERVKANQITTTPDHVTHVMKVQQGLTVTNFQKKELPNLCVPHRRLVCTCRLFEVYDINKKERVGQHQREIFLFNDLLLVTKIGRRVRANTTQLFTYRQSISLQGLYVQLFQSTHYNFGIKLCQRSNNETLIMFNARNELDQSRFVDDLGEYIAEMDEMETIKAHNIIETIHFKHLDRLRRHSMMHNNNINENNSQPILINDDNQQQKNTNNKLKLNNMINNSCDNNTSVIINKETQPITVQAIKGDKDRHQQQQQQQKSLNVNKINATANNATTTGNSIGYRVQAKFSSMLNLSSLALGGSSGGNNANAMTTQDVKRGDNINGSKGLKHNQSFIVQQQQQQQLSKENQKASIDQNIVVVNGLERNEPTQQNQHSVQEQVVMVDGQQQHQQQIQQRRLSTSSVHSLDSGLFLSRDVSPNQSS